MQNAFCCALPLFNAKLLPNQKSLPTHHKEDTAMSKEPTTNSQGLSEECHAMISRISHEVRNPVAVIHSFHQLLLLAHPELSNDLYFQKIQENMAFLNSLLDELSCYNHSYRAVRAYVNPYLCSRISVPIPAFSSKNNRFPLNLSRNLPFRALPLIPRNFVSFF